jgi:two-component system sensor histidine kinase RpfC
MAWCGLVLYAFGDSGILIWGMYIWLVIGYGFRYGVKYLYAATTAALVSFYTVAYFSPYYRENYEIMTLGTFLLAVVIPVYLGSLLRTLQRNLEAAREADRLKTRFLANVSHDLRTPLNAIMANCEILSHELHGGKRHLRPLTDMREATTTLGGLVTDLLDIAKIEAGRVRLESSPFNVVELLGRIRRFNEPNARQKKTRIYLTVDPATPARACGDKLRLEQILNNIVSNAVKYTDNGYIHIDAKPDVNRDNGNCKGFLCSVRDTGIGMDSDATDRIFCRFEQADASYARRYSGAGLGLSIASELVNLMGGSITVESEKGKGSCFTVSLPLRLHESTVVEQPQTANSDTLLVICSPTRQEHWHDLCDGHTLPRARILTTDGEGLHAAAFAYRFSDPDCVLVDAAGMQGDLDKLPDLALGALDSSDASYILLNAPLDNSDPGSYRAYRSVCATATADVIQTAIAIASWTRHCEQTVTMDESHLETYCSELKHHTVLVADDNELNRRVIANLLTYANIRVIEACDGRDALNKFAEHRVDVALLDIQMPELTGIEVIRSCAAQAAVNAIPLIALTADTTDQCRSQCLDAGATSILYKPVSMRSLFSELDRVIRVADSLPDDAQAQNSVAPCVHGTVDYDLLKELTQSAQHPDYFPGLIACFKKEGGQLLRQLRHELRNGDIGGSRALLHRLKGMSSAIGANTIATLCHNKLNAPDTELRRSAGALIEQLIRLHRETADALESYLSCTSPATLCSTASIQPLGNDVFIRSSDSLRCSSSL